ncbi:hypothetical protein DRF69_04890 [Chryseobacterium sp. 5_R23647]|nr:hypothetical protein DRF69_04890 [Chryseobacterium sp. 5_R23647]
MRASEISKSNDEFPELSKAKSVLFFSIRKIRFKSIIWMEVKFCLQKIELMNENCLKSKDGIKPATVLGKR